jgi:hypothetical protein
MYREQLRVGLLLTALCVMLSLQPALASVGLISFTAEASGSSIVVRWETATEENMIGFKLYRSITESSPGVDLYPEGFPAKGNAQTGDTYQYEDVDVTQGVKYYYLLKEVTSSGGLVDIDGGKTSAGIGLQTDTPAPTI